MTEEATTRDLVELTRLAFEAANRRDIDAVMGFFAPDAVFQGRAAGDIAEGQAAIRALAEGWWGSFAEGFRYEVERSVVRDDGVVLVAVNIEGRPVGVDGQVHQREGWAIWWSAAGLMMRVTVHADIDEAGSAAEQFANANG